jgi:phosphoglucomutase
LLQPNHYLAVSIDYLFRHRRNGTRAAIGKTLVSTALIDRVAKRLGRTLYESPVGFKWFVDGLLRARLVLVARARASFLRRDGSAWTTDKDGIAPALLSAEMTARAAVIRASCTAISSRRWANFSPTVDAQRLRRKKRSWQNSPQQVHGTLLAGEKIESVLDRAPGNNAPIGGIKVTSAAGWFAARPSGTEDVYKIYAESFRSEAHLREILREAQAIVDAALANQ